MADKKTTVQDKSETEQVQGDVATGEQQVMQSVGAQIAEKTAGSVETEGVRARRGLMMKQMIPDIDWIMKNVVGGGKGTRATIGRIYGVVTNTQRRAGTLPDGTPSETIACGGVLNMESYVTGELSQGSNCFFPMAYAEKIEALLRADPTIKVIEVDCDIGLEATGKAIPYEWVITAFREGEEMAVLKRIKGTRPRPDNILIGPDGAVKQLTAPVK